MKKILAIIVFIAYSFTAFSQTAVAYPESGFSVAFPAKPAISKTTMDSAAGKIDLVMYMSQSDDAMALLSENKYPADLISKLDAAGTKKLIDGAKNGALNNVAKQMNAKLTVVSETNSLFDDKYISRGTEGKIGDYDFHAFFIIRGNQMYQMLVIGNTSAESAKHFFKSFKLL